MKNDEKKHAEWLLWRVSTKSNKCKQRTVLSGKATAREMQPEMFFSCKTMSF